MTNTPTVVRVAGAVLCSTVLTLASALTLPLPVAQAAALPCAAGTPVQGDIDGDTLPDLLIEATDTRINGTSYRWLPGDGGSQSWLDTSADLDRPLHMADLNGDLCMDAVGGVSANWSDTSVVLFLGTPSGLDTAAPIRLGLPRAAQLRDPERLLFTVAGTRHHGTSQTAVTGSVNLESGFHSPFLDVLTPDSTAHLASIRSFDLGPLGARGGEEKPVVADDGLIAVGSYNDTVGSADSAGAVYLFSSDANDPASVVFRTRITQNSPGIAGTAEADDMFGAALALRDGRLAIGAERETVGRTEGAGIVQPVLWHPATNTYTAYRSISQNTKDVPGSNEKNDGFGSVLVVTRRLTANGSYDIAIGTPGEDVGSRTDAGSVTVANFSRSTYRTYTPESAHMPGTVERGDRFGASLAAVPGTSSRDSLLIGTPGERTSGCSTSGWVTRSNATLLGGSTRWSLIPAPCDGHHADWGTAFAN